MVVGIGLGVPVPISKGRSAHPAITVPEASRFKGFTRSEGSSNDEIGWVAVDTLRARIIRALYAAVNPVAKIAKDRVSNPVKEAEADSSIKSLE